MASDSSGNEKICVLYDGSCPSCVQDRRTYEKWAGPGAEDVAWVDITGRDDWLRAQGIDPRRALLELHVIDAKQQVHAELDAYILLMRRTRVFRPLGWLLARRWLRKPLGYLYRAWVVRRLKREGRY